MVKKNKKNENKKDIDKLIKNVEFAVSQIEKNDFTFYFFVLDSKNVPNSTMCYIYQLAKAIQDKGYKVCMVYQMENEYSEEELKLINEKDGMVDENRVFVGVSEWLGEEYANLPHLNIAKEPWNVGAYDFLFIPEAFSGLMYLTLQKQAPCKRYVILHDFNYVSEFIPLGHQWANYGIDHVVTTCKEQAERINDVFPYTKQHTTIIPPYFPAYFRKPLTAKKMIVNLIAKDKDDVNRIIKPFYWKYPMYSFVSFRDLRGFPRKRYAELLQEGQITVWCDDKTPFGHSAIEALKCGNLLIGKMPDIIPEWMSDDNGLWFNDITDAPDLIYKAVATLLSDEMPETLQKGIDEAEKLYPYEVFDKAVTDFVDNMKKERINELTRFGEIEKNNVKKEEK
ncbi:MAG: hypothetical protein J6X18_09060 [Bacteroidales bacterium]|nr:hypothetical protein [Bacteroidales bacterium]